MKILLGSIMHESNTFAPTVTDVEVFKKTQYLFGEDIVRYHRGQRSEIGGIIDVFDKYGVSALPVLSAWAMSYGKVSADTYRMLKRTLLQGIRDHQDEIDGVLLVLHGSMTVEGIEDGEGDLLRSVRETVGDRMPVAATLDHHANVSEAMVENSDFFVGYRTHPHVDQYEVGYKAAGLMVDLIEKKPVLKKSFIKIPLITAAENRSEPIKALAASIERIEKDPDIFTASFFVAYPWADVSIIGASVQVVARTNEETAHEYARELATQLWDLRASFRFDIYSIEEAVAIGMETEGKPVLLDELSDCTLGGAAGDVVTSVRYLVENDVRDSVVVGIVDPDAAKRASDAGVGAELQIRIGGTITKKGNPPFAINARVVKLDENTAGSSDIHSGYETRIGKVAVLKANDVEIIIIENPGKIGGPSFLEALGIDPRKKDFILTKEGLNPFVDYKDIASRILMVDTPGFDPQILRPEDYRNVPRPIYPLDPDMTWNPDK